jgi:hypothetical protein
MSSRGAAKGYVAKSAGRPYIRRFPFANLRNTPMAKLQPLDTFSLQETEDGYRLLVSAVGGEALYVSITPDQMDDIIESLEAAMGGEEEEGVEEDEAF